MPRSPDGTYTLPTGTLVNTGDTLLVTQHNPAMQDIAEAIGSSLDRDGLGGMRAPLGMGGFAIQNVSPGVNPTDAATISQLSTAGGSPVGSVVDFAGSVAPSGWLLCGGQSLNRSDYPDLFAVIGTTYGSMSGTTFSLPDCRGRVSAGRDFDQGGLANRLTSVASNTLGAAGGAQTVALTIAQLAAHTHTGSTASAGDHSHSIAKADSGSGGDRALTSPSAPAGSISTGTAGAHTHTMSLDNTGSGEAHPNVQPTIIFNKIIKAS